MNDFKVLLEAVLDANSIKQSDINKIQKVISKYHLNLTADLDKASVIAEIKKIVPQLEAELKKMTGVDIQINDQALLRAFNQIEKQAESTAQKLNNIKYSLDTEKYSKDVAKINNELSKVGKFTLSDKNNKDVFKEANTSAQLLKTTYDQLKSTMADTNATDQQKIQIENQYQQVLERTKNLISQINLSKDDEKVSVTDNRRVNMIATLNTYLSKNTAMTKTNKKQIETWIATLSSSDDMTVGAIKNINSEFKQLDASLRATGKLGLSTWDKFKQAWEKFGGWSLATGALTRMFQEVKKGVQFIGELDDALTDVAYTSNTSKSQLIDLGDSAIDMAKDLNTSAKNVLEAVKIYSTAKSTADDILRKSKPALMLSNVSGMSGSESSKTINTALNQFELEDTEENLMDIVDTYEYVASQLNYDFTDAIKELTEGIEASGSVAKNAGLNMQEYATMVGIAVEKTGQSGSTIGQAYKTLFSRITKASATEGTLDEDISEAEKSLRSVGVEVRDSADNFRDLTDIMADLGAVWSSLSSVEKSNIGYNIAGTRQLNVLNSLLGAWDDYSAIIGTVDERTGEALENQEIYADSLQGHLGDLEATAQSTWNNVIDSEELKTGVDMLNGLLTLINGLTESVGSLGTIGLGAGLFAGIKNFGRPKMFGLCFEIAENHKCSLGY